uniref:Uncharacterized protein n=1 Tax=viral metagenome TaxID=1070528 RepID=A0A6C0C4L1_9ZZZZ
MEPQIIDYYNEFPHSINVIDKMNKELNDIQKENNILKDDLYMNPEYGRPTVEYESEEALENKKNELYNNLKDEIYKSNGIIGERNIKKILYKLIPNYNHVEITYNAGLVNEHTRVCGSNWVHWKSCDILKNVDNLLKSLRKSNIESEKICENIYNFITNEIDDLMGIGGNIVKYKCRRCGNLTDLIMKPPISDNVCGDCHFNDILNSM